MDIIQYNEWFPPKPDETIPPGVYDMSLEQYHREWALGKSGLSNFARAAKKFLYEYLTPSEPTTAMTIGSAAHSMIMEPDVFPKEYAIWKGDRKAGKEYKTFAEANAGKTVLSQTQYDQALGMTIAVKEHPMYDELFTGGVSERSFFWDDDEFKCPCKCRPDYLPGAPRVVDLKTTGTTVDEWNFGKVCYSLKYHWSAAWTLRGLEAVTGVKHRDYIIVAVEQAPPHLMMVYQLDQAAIDLATLEIEDVLFEYIESCKTGVWPGLPTEMRGLTLPSWAYKQLDQQGGIYDSF